MGGQSRRAGGVKGEEEEEEEEAQEWWGMLYADDAGIVSRLPGRLERMMTVVITASSAFALAVSEAKTDVICQQKKNGGKVSLTVAAAGQVYKEPIEVAYLGGAIRADRELSVETMRRLQRTWA